MWISSSARSTGTPSRANSSAICARPASIAAASPAATMPCAPSIAAWARLAAISSSHNRLSMGIEAFISCMIAAGPPPKRPPHMLLLSGESAIRRVPNSKIAILALLLAGSVAGCDREKHRAEQAGAPQANISGGEAARGAPTFQHVIDRSHAGQVAPTAAFRGPDDEIGRAHV